MPARVQGFTRAVARVAVGFKYGVLLAAFEDDLVSR